MRCECCTKKFGRREIVHGIRFGTVDADTDVFIPDREAAATVICQSCGERLLKLVYAKLKSSRY